MADAVLAQPIFDFVTDPLVGIPPHRRADARLGSSAWRASSGPRGCATRTFMPISWGRARARHELPRAGTAAASRSPRRSSSPRSTTCKSREAGNFFASERLRAVDQADPDTFKGAARHGRRLGATIYRKGRRPSRKGLGHHRTPGSWFDRGAGCCEGFAGAKLIRAAERHPRPLMHVGSVVKIARCRAARWRIIARSVSACLLARCRAPDQRVLAVGVAQPESKPARMNRP